MIFNYRQFFSSETLLHICSVIPSKFTKNAHVDLEQCFSERVINVWNQLQHLGNKTLVRKKFGRPNVWATSRLGDRTLRRQDVRIGCRIF